jgi:hypothetical protein
MCWAALDGGILAESVQKKSQLRRLCKYAPNKIIDEALALFIPDPACPEYLIPKCWLKDDPRSNMGPGWSSVRARILERDEWTCGYCGNEAEAVDHIHPRSKGGGNEDENLVACCKPCNSRKKDRLLHECGMELLAVARG